MNPPPDKSKRTRRMRRFISRLLAFVVSLLVGLLICEWVVRRVAPQVVSVPTIDVVDGIFCQPANLHGRQFIPGQFDVEYESNSQRFRATHEITAHSAPGVTRIIAIGDSFTFGMGSPYKDTFPVLLEKRLNDSGGKYEVINAGSMNTGTGMQALWYDRWVSNFHPDIVVLTVYANDIEDDLGQPVFETDPNGQVIPCSPQAISARLKPSSDDLMYPIRSFIAEHSHLANLLKRLGTRVTRQNPAIANSSDAVAKRHELFEQRGMPLMRGELHWLKQRVDASGARLIVQWCPPRELIYQDPGPKADEMRWQAERVLKIVRQFVTDESVPFCDLTDTLQAGSPDAPGELYYKILDRHLKPAGNQLVAAQLHGLIKSQNAHVDQSPNSVPTPKGLANHRP